MKRRFCWSGGWENHQQTTTTVSAAAKNHSAQFLALPLNSTSSLYLASLHESLPLQAYIRKPSTGFSGNLCFLPLETIWLLFYLLVLLFYMVTPCPSPRREVKELSTLGPGKNADTHNPSVQEESLQSLHKWKFTSSFFQLSR